MQAEWRRHPPVHHLVASYLGYKPEPQTSAEPVHDIEEVMHLLGDLPIRTVAPLDTSAFDAAFPELKNG